MKTSKSREAFEKVILGMGMLIVRARGGEYDVEEVDFAWKVWQASRESIEVVLEDIDSFSPNDCGDEAVWLTELVRALRTAGIRIKGESECVTGIFKAMLSVAEKKPL